MGLILRPPGSLMEDLVVPNLLKPGLADVAEPPPPPKRLGIWFCPADVGWDDDDGGA